MRLSVFIKAPTQRVATILLRNENLKNLLDNEWIYLMVMDPLQNNEIKRYISGMEWLSITEKKTSETFKRKEVDAILSNIIIT